MLFPLVACIVIETQTEHADVIEEGPFERAEIELGSGDVVVTGDAEATGATGRFTATFSDTPPEIESYVDDGVLHVRAACEGVQVVCEVSLDLTVPATIDADVRTGSGDLTVEGITGDVAGESGSGDLCVRGSTGYLDVSSGSGDLVLEDLAGELVAETGSGDVSVRRSVVERARIATGSGDVSFEQVAAFVRIDTETGSGDVGLRVPAGAYALAVETGSGDIDLGAGIQENPASESLIVARTGSGDVTVTGTEP